MDRIDIPPTAPAEVAGPVRFSVRNRVGFVLALLFGLADATSLLQPTPDGEVGPPFAVLVVSSLCGLVTLAAVGYGWRRHSRPAVRVAAGSRVVSVLLSLPAFFVAGLPAGLRLLVAVSTVLTIVCVALMLAPPRRTAEAVR